MWKSFFLLFVLGFSSVVDLINQKYALVSGESTDLFTLISEVPINSTGVPFGIVLLNNSLTHSLQIHYFEYESLNKAQIVTHISPKYIINTNYDSEGIKAVLNQQFKIKGEIAIIQENEMKIEAFLTYNQKIEVKLCETIVFVNHAVYKVYAMNEPGNLTFYSWKVGEGKRKLRSLKISMAFGFLLGSIVMAGGTYLYFNAKKKFPFVKFRELSVVNVE